MTQSDKIRILKDRDLNSFFADGLLFIRQNFKVLFLSFLYFAGPLILLSALLTSYSIVSTLGAIGSGGFNFGGFLWATVFAYILSILINILIISVTMSIFKLYELHGPKGFGLDQVWRESLRMILPSTGIFILIFLMIIIPAAIVVGLFALLANAGAGVAILFAFLLIIGGLLAIPLGYFFFGIYPGRLLESFSVGGAISRSWKLMSSKYWFTWVIIFLLILMTVVISICVTLPMTLFMQISIMSGISDGSGFSMNTPILIIIQVIASLLTHSIYPFFYSLLTLHHFNLAEKLEGRGTIQQMNELGTKNDEPV